MEIMVSYCEFLLCYIQQIFIEHLLCAKYCAKHWENNGEPNPIIAQPHDILF